MQDSNRDVRFVGGVLLACALLLLVAAWVADAVRPPAPEPVSTPTPVVQPVRPVARGPAPVPQNSPASRCSQSTVTRGNVTWRELNERGFPQQFAFQEDAAAALSDEELARFTLPQVLAAHRTAMRYLRCADAPEAARLAERLAAFVRRVDTARSAQR